LLNHFKTTMTIPLQKAQTGRMYKVVTVSGTDVQAQRIRELGVVLGAELIVLRRHPFGGPLEIQLATRKIGIRLGSVHVVVEPVAENPEPLQGSVH